MEAYFLRILLYIYAFTSKKIKSGTVWGGGFLYLDVILLSGFDEALHDFY